MSAILLIVFGARGHRVWVAEKWLCFGLESRGTLLPLGFFHGKDFGRGFGWVFLVVLGGVVLWFLTLKVSVVPVVRLVQPVCESVVPTFLGCRRILLCQARLPCAELVTCFLSGPRLQNVHLDVLRLSRGNRRLRRRLFLCRLCRRVFHSCRCIPSVLRW
jgi:hypothetical protein